MPKKKVVLSICILLILIEFSVVAHSIVKYFHSQNLTRAKNETYKLQNTSSIVDENLNLTAGLVKLDFETEIFSVTIATKIVVVCL